MPGLNDIKPKQTRFYQNAFKENQLASKSEGETHPESTRLGIANTETLLARKEGPLKANNLDEI